MVRVGKSNLVGAFLLAFMLMGMLFPIGGTVLANTPLSLDSIIEERTTQYVTEEPIFSNETYGEKSSTSAYDEPIFGESEPLGNNEQVVRDSASSVVDNLGAAATVDLNDPRAKSIGGTINRIVGGIVAIVCYIIAVGIILSVVIDITYIGLPFTRKILGNGYTGNASAGDARATGGMMGGTGMGMGGYGGYGGGLGGFIGSPYGSRFGMGRGSMGVGMNGMNSPGAQQDQAAMMAGRLQIVSNAALNAAASEITVDADGRNTSPFKLYLSDMIWKLVLTPILIILAVSGALWHIGMVVGNGLVVLLTGLNGIF